MSDRPTELPGSIDPSMPGTIIRERPAAAAVAAAGAAEQGAAPGSGDLTDELLRTDQWTDDMLARAGIPVGDVPFVSIGGGTSFTLPDGTPMRFARGQVWVVLKYGPGSKG